MILKGIFFILWLLGITVLILTLHKIYVNPDDLSKYLASIGILISAFIASTTVLISIQNTKEIERLKENRTKKMVLTYLSQICNSIYIEIDKNKMIWPRKEIKEKKELFSNYYIANEDVLTSHLESSKFIFEILLTKLNDKEFYSYSEIVSSLEGINKFLYEFNVLTTQLQSHKNDEKDDKNHRSFFNTMQVIHMTTNHLEELLIEINTQLMLLIPDIQRVSLLNTSLTLDNDRELPLFYRIQNKVKNKI